MLETGVGEAVVVILFAPMLETGVGEAVVAILFAPMQEISVRDVWFTYIISFVPMPFELQKFTERLTACF
jgi:hypothetical protein